MWAQWLASFPELGVLPLDLGGLAAERRIALPLGALPERLLAAEERELLAALHALPAGRPGECGSICEAALEDGLRHPDLYLLAGACALETGRVAAARAHLANAWLYRTGVGGHRAVGIATRRILPGLRLLLRIAPTQLLPLHPSPYAAGLLYAVALDYSGEPEQALIVLREMIPLFGMTDEVRITAARIHFTLGNFDTAVGALTHDESSEQDALEYTRSLYLALSLRELGQSRQAAQELGRATRTIAAVNQHTQARARLLLGELFADCGLLLDSLRESGGVEPEVLPGFVAHDLLEQEASVLRLLKELNGAQLELLAEADPFQVYLPDLPEAKGLTNKLDVARDPLKALRSGSLSWIRNKEHNEAVAAAQIALAEGREPALQFITRLSAAAVDVQKRIKAAQDWWHGRELKLRSAMPRPELALTETMASPHLRFDFRGTRELEYAPWHGEARARELLRWAGIVAGIALALILVRSMFGG